MRTIRRLYFYAVAFISLEVVLWGVIGLLRSIFSTALVDAADALAQALSLVLVGVPIFLIHWLWVQRAAGKDDEERTASLRAIFFYAVLLATLVPVVQNLIALLNRVVLGAADIDSSRAFLGGVQTWQDNIIAIIVNSVVAYYFWNVLRAAWQNLSEFKDFADVRRLYRYLWLLYPLFMVVFGSQQILRFIFNISLPTYLLGDVGRELFANGFTLLVVGTPLWIYTWRVCQAALADSVERGSNLRLGILYLLALGGVITVLSTAGTLLSILLRWGFGEALAGYEVLRDIGVPISLGLPFAGVWAYYGLWLNSQIDLDGDGFRRAGKKRFYFYILSLLGLGATFIGLTLILSFVIDLLASDALWGSTLRARLAGAISTLLVGIPLWILTWRPLQADALSKGEPGDHARRSTIRRTYLYLALFAGVIGGMVSAVWLVFTLLSALLTAEIEPDFIPDVLNAAQVLILFALLLIYHFVSLRRDGIQAGKTLEDRQRAFPIGLLDMGNETFLKAIHAEMAKHAPGVPTVAIPMKDRMPMQGEDLMAVIIPVSIALDPPDQLRRWLNKFSGKKILVIDILPRGTPDEKAEADSSWVTIALTPAQAAQSARQLAEGENIRLSRPSAVWEIIKTVAVIWLGLQVLLVLFSIGLSLLVD